LKPRPRRARVSLKILLVRAVAVAATVMVKRWRRREEMGFGVYGREKCNGLAEKRE
jgi:hypothetical protein